MYRFQAMFYFIAAHGQTASETETQRARLIRRVLLAS